MDVGGLSNSYKTLKQCHFLNDGGLRWTIADRRRGCGDASRALLFVNKDKRLLSRAGSSPTFELR
jgi:hypothetical protein